MNGEPKPLTDAEVDDLDAVGMFDLDADTAKRFCAQAKEANALRERVAHLEESIRWALGEDVPGPEFAPKEHHYPPYWWRSALRERAGLKWSISTAAKKAITDAEGKDALS